MRTFYKLAFISIFTASSLSSCYSPKFMVDDDVYILKNNKLPVGESLNDESSYASYRHQRTDETVSSSLYDDEFINRQNFHRDIWMFSMGYNNPYYNNWMFGYRPNFGFPYNSPYMYGYVNPLYMYDPFGNSYGFYSPAYNPWYMGGNYGYGSNWGMNGNGNPMGYNNYSGNYTVQYNHHSGPRGSNAGFGNPAGRLQGITLKSTQQPNNNNGLISRNSAPKRIDNSVVVGQYSKPITASPSRNNNNSRLNVNYKPTSDRGIRNPTLSSSSVESRSTQHSPSGQRNTDSRGNYGGGRIDTPSRSNGGGTPSIGSGRSGSGSAPSNSGGRRN